MYVGKALFVTIFTCKLIFYHHYFLLAFTIVHSANPAATFYIGDVAVNCGSSGKSSAFDGREWIGDAASDLMSALQPKGKSKRSIAVDKSFSADPVPYKTSRISAAPFYYKFQVSPGQKFIRLHFLPVPYHGYRDSEDFFTVKAGPFTLLHNFSASLASKAFGGTFIVKEFCLNVEVRADLVITFSPSEGSKSRKMHAFVNGIEIISMPTGLYYTKDSEKGALIVGQHDRFIAIDNSTALELIERLNTGGSSISSVEDFGLFRRWNGDANHLMENRVYQVIHPAIKFTDPYLAPPKVYRTSWKLEPNVRIQGFHTFRWKIPIDIGFGYLVRLHFCASDLRMNDGGEKEFSIVMNDQIAETEIDVFSWSGGSGIPLIRDYMVMLKGEKLGGKSDLLIDLRATNVLVVGQLYGMEIFKLSNPDNSLAAPNQVLQRRMSSSWKQKIQVLFSLSKNNVITTGTVMLLVLANTIVYNLRQSRELSLQKGKLKPSPIDPSFCCFSLSEIMSATQQFSDTSLIGRGGFGKVYKGFITGISQVAAIKRLNANSKQGAREFWAEVETLSKFRHNHLVSLIGYCNEGSEMILVYEYMPRGTLADNIYKLARNGNDSAILNWELRLRICIGAAHGLDYLHTGTEHGVIHRDVKDTNILLDENFVAKISDFGLSKMEKFSESKSYMSTKVKGTYGYLDPEYHMTKKLTREVDVYAFGVVLLVVLSGRPAVDVRNFEDQQSLLSSFRDCIAEGDFEAIVDPSMQGRISPNSLKEFVKSIENCLHHQPKKRPTMAQVATSLEKALEHQERPTLSVTEDVADTILLSEDGNTESKFSQSPSPPMPEESVTWPPKGNSTKEPIQSPPLTTNPEEAKIREDSPSAKKTIWNWPWRTVWSRGKPMKKTVQNWSGSPIRRDGFWETKTGQYSFSDILKMTKDFERILGEGGFGRVYYGVTERKQVAVKLLDNSSIQRYHEFLGEVQLLTRIHHRNITSLVGYCCESNHKALVFEYMDNGNLSDHILGKNGNILSWSQRLLIAMDAARGLEYLHSGCKPSIIHRDIKSSNILLNEKNEAKLAGFRVSQSVSDYSVITEIFGTYGYIDPEYLETGRPTVKSDIYSFGIVILELITGRPAFTRNDDELADDKCHIYQWVGLLLAGGGGTASIVDPKLKGMYDTNSVERALVLAMACACPSSAIRPRTADVVTELEECWVLEEGRTRGQKPYNEFDDS